ncbi:MAG TPA: DUF3131 domain-containing protein [Gemmatimonadaceae bacterium]|jgi:hypothetical protein|nr:DUF3131 domain-containing protein [Gemmatimonadaceae bacterium]
MRFHSLVCSLLLIGLVGSVGTAEAQSRSRKKSSRTTRTTTTRKQQEPAPARIDSAPLVTSPIATAAIADERQLFMNASRAAWAFVERNYQPSTGLARAHDTYQYVTLWDVASALAATYSAHELGLIADAPYNQRMQRALATLGSMDLFDGAAFNKSYDSRTGRMIDRNQRLSSKGYGWSTTDIGRLLIWLRIIAVNQPQFAPQATAIVKRLNMPRMIVDGYLQGSDIDPQTGQLRAYPEGRIGYEQYAAAGLALWGYRAEKALDASLNALPVNVLGVSIVADKRGDERVTSEPYIMMGMETGWYSPELREQAWRVLAAQEARYKTTGTLTMVSEDALPDPPYYFYYYNVYRQGRSFTVDAPASSGYTDRPRWLSSKAAFAWHALLPSAYTLAVVQAVQGAMIPGRGWGAGVYEGSLRPTGDASLNTAALILEAAFYNLRGHPFLATKL